MRYLLFTFLIFFTFQSLNAQEFEIRGDFKTDPNDLAARRNEARTVNDEPCALIKITTNIKGMQFDSNIGIVNVVHQNDGYWVYVAPRERRIKIMAKGYISIDIDMPEPARSYIVYNLVVASKGTYHTSNLVRVTFRMNQNNVYIQTGENAPVLSIGSNATFNIPKGERIFRFIKNGFSEEVKTINIENEEIIDITLKQGELTTKLSLSGHIIVMSDPSEAEVYLNEQRVGSTPYQNKHLAGKYVIRIQQPNYYDHIEQFELKEGATIEIPKITLKPRFGYIQVNSNPNGAEVLLNGRIIGSTPIMKQVISSGFHEVTIRKSNYYEQKENLNINDGENKTLNIELKEAFGYLKITSEPTDANIYIDNSAVGQTPFQNNQMPSGKYNVRISKELYADANETVTVVDGKKVEKFIALTKNYGTLKINSFGSEISINGKAVGSNSYTANLIPGEFKIKASKDKHRDDERTIFLMLGQTEEITLNPTPLQGAVSIITNPFETRGAEIYIDGLKNKQTTPATIPLLIGSYNILVKKPGYFDASQSVVIREGQEQDIVFTMQTYRGSLQAKAKKYKKAKFVYGLATLATISTGAYFRYSTIKLNDDYQVATSNATETFDKLERHNLYSWVSFGAAVPLGIMTIVKAVQQKKVKSKITTAVLPTNKGAIIGITYNF